MKKIFIKKTLLVLAAFGVLFAAISCKNVSQPAEVDSGTKVQEGPVLRIKASSGKKAVSKSNKKIINSERTIMPESDITTFTDFVFTGKNVDDNDFQTLGEYDDINELYEAEITLNKDQVSEDWTFKLTAMNGSAQYSGSTTVTLEDGDNEIFIILKNAETGNGGFIVTVDFSAVGERADLADYAVLELYGDGDCYDGVTLNNLKTDPDCSFEWQLSGVPTGSYILYVDIFTAEGALLATWTEGVIVNSYEECEGTIYIQYFDVLYNVTYVLENADDDDVDFAPMTQISPSTYEISIPTRTGYIFTGWYTDDNYKTLLEMPITEDITLYGGWVPDSVSASEAANTIAQIHGKSEEHPATLKITGLPSSSDIAAIDAALIANKDSYFIIDLSETGLTILNKRSFEKCENLVGVVLPETLETIDYCAFYGCTSLKSIIIPDSVTKIDDFAFVKCYALESVTIGKGYCSEQLAKVFKDCCHLNEIIIPDDHPCYSISDGIIYSAGVHTTLFWYPPYLDNESFVIGSSVFSIPEYAFYGNKELKTIEIGQFVNSIGAHCFDACDNLESISVRSNNGFFKVVDDVLLTKDDTVIVFYPSTKTDNSYQVPYTVMLILPGVFTENDYLEEVILPDDDDAIWYYSTEFYDEENNGEPYSLFNIMGDWEKFDDSCDDAISVNINNYLYKVADPINTLYDYLDDNNMLAGEVTIYGKKILDATDASFTRVETSDKLEDEELGYKYFVVSTEIGKDYYVDFLNVNNAGVPYTNIPDYLYDGNIFVLDGVLNTLESSYNELELCFTAESEITYIQADNCNCLFRVRNYYQVGDVLLSDGTVLQYSNQFDEDGNLSFTDEQKANAVGVLYDIDEDGNPRGWLGIHNSGETKYLWAGENTTGLNTNFTDIQCTPSEYASNGSADRATFTGDTDGSDNWDYICSVDSDAATNAATNYPAFDYVNNYASTYGLTGDYETGWYMPSLAELCYIYRNIDGLNAVLNALGATKLSGSVGSFEFWSSSQKVNQEYAVYTVYLSNGYISVVQKDYTGKRVCVVRSFDN